MEVLSSQMVSYIWGAQPSNGVSYMGWGAQPSYMGGLRLQCLWYFLLLGLNIIQLDRSPQVLMWGSLLEGTNTHHSSYATPEILGVLGKDHVLISHTPQKVT